MGTPAHTPVRAGDHPCTARDADSDRALAMSMVETFDRSVVVPSIARRAVDLARDVRTPSDDGAEHLVRLAMGRRDVLTAALGELVTHAPSSDVACAELLLIRAIEAADDEAGS